MTKHRPRRILVTGSAGHLGEALVRSLRTPHALPGGNGVQVVGIDRLPSASTDRVGSIVDPGFVAEVMHGVDAVLHAATLHKPHVATHARQAFVDVNVTGTLNLLEAAVAAGVRAFVFTSTTSAFGHALTPPPGAPAAWITEDVRPVPKNIYGVTKVAAEDLCELFHRLHGLPVVVLRTSRFFPEGDDDAARRAGFGDANLKVNELLHRRLDLQDAVDAHLAALRRAPDIGFARLVVSATPPFAPGDAPALRHDVPGVLAQRVPGWAEVYARLSWRMYDGIDRVYDDARARLLLGWQPRHTFAAALAALARGDDWASPLARVVGSKGYHRDEPRSPHGSAVPG